MTAPSLFRAARLLVLFGGLVFAATGAVLAQGAALRTPHVSRMCLWNADKDVWRALHLHRDQVRHLNVIRQRYPAVVQGQWVNEADSAALDIPDARDRNPLGAPSPSAQGMRAGKTGGNPFGPEARMERIGLQAELREVLSEEQLRLWEERCSMRR